MRAGVQGAERQEEEGGHADLDSQRKGRCAVVKTSTRQTIFLPVCGRPCLVPASISIHPPDHLLAGLCGASLPRLCLYLCLYLSARQLY